MGVEGVVGGGVEGDGGKTRCIGLGSCPRVAE